MIRENHYQALKKRIANLHTGLTHHKECLPAEFQQEFSIEYYGEALQTLEKRKKKLEKKKQDYQTAVEQFCHDYEAIRKTWKKDTTKLRRILSSSAQLLQLFGLHDLQK